MNIVARAVPENARLALEADGLHPALARVLAARGVEGSATLDMALTRLLPWSTLAGVDHLAVLLADAIAAKQRLVIVADYDCDGATACAVGVLALRAFGADVQYLVPNRFEYGYGLTPEIVRLAHEKLAPDILITVDNGIASVDGVAEANRLGLRVIVTDHHLPGAELPAAACIVNPNQAGCPFPSKSIAGVGVMFYCMLALRAELKKRGAFGGAEVPSSLIPHPSSLKEPNLGSLLDLVALGTVADVVRLDDNNRILVTQGLRRIRAGRARPGIRALLNAAGRETRRAAAYDLGFVVGPRLNAAGRLTDMALGIEGLLTDDPARAEEIAQNLDQLNRQRRDIEAGMQEAALASLERIAPEENYSLSLFDPEWHQGVIGILASRLKDRFHRPAIAFARGSDGEIKGSGRSIAGLHLRDALDLVAKRAPDLILRFGGHAAAAGLTLREADFGRFQTAFEAVARTLLTPGDLAKLIETDGALPAAWLTLEAAEALDEPVWGQGFPSPSFDGEFEVREQRIVGTRHLRLKLATEGRAVDAIAFGRTEPLPDRVRAVYRLAVNEFRDMRSLQLIVEHIS
ncbi:MAG: single-stranded-DNA-specific exonuclease RecJ [Burkholderiales bacterium]